MQIELTSVLFLHFLPTSEKTEAWAMVTITFMGVMAPEEAAAAEAATRPGTAVLCPDGASHHTLVANANASGHWAATLQLEKDSRLFRRAEAVRLDVQPAAYACGDVRTVAMMVQMTGPPTVASVATTPASTPESNERVPPSRLGYARAPTFPKFYKVYEVKLNWNDAKTACESDGAHLVIVNSPEEASALAYLIHPHAKSITRTLHAGFFAASTEYYTVLEDSLDSHRYKKWAPSEPKHAEICGAIDHAGNLCDAFCSRNVKRNFVCEYGDPPPVRRPARRSGSASPTFPTPAATTGSPEGYTRLPGAGAYKVHLENASWAEASATCQKEGAQLAVVQSEAEASALHQYLTALPEAQTLPRELHVGIFSHSVFVTIFGDDLSDAGYEGWADEEPNNHPCVVALHDMSTNSVGCTLKTAFICEQAVA